LNDTVNGECCLKLLQDHFVPAVQGIGVNIEETFSQQDGAILNKMWFFISCHYLVQFGIEWSWL
jgi:hypothetical protein